MLNHMWDSVILVSIPVVTLWKSRWDEFPFIIQSTAVFSNGCLSGRLQCVMIVRVGSVVIYTGSTVRVDFTGLPDDVE